MNVQNTPNSQASVKKISTVVHSQSKGVLQTMMSSPLHSHKCSQDGKEIVLLVFVLPELKLRGSLYQAGQETCFHLREGYP